MAYWMGEIAGWLLVMGGLWLVGIVIEFCNNRWILEAAIVGIISIFVFRGGIHLLKVAVAAKICREAWVRENLNDHQTILRPKRPLDPRESPRPAGFSPTRD